MNTNTEVFYKYRSLDDWKFFIDIILNERLFAATFKNLNDPMEGRYYYDELISKEFRRYVGKSRRDLRICSLTQNPKNTLMWSYYSAGHTGVVIEFTLPRKRSQILRPMDYDSGLHLEPGHEQSSPEQVAIDILCQKMESWRHEEEIRVFTQEEFVPIRIKRILLGCRISESNAKLVRKLIRKTNLDVPVRKIARNTLDVTPVP